MSESLKERLTAAMKDSMRNKEKARLSTIRMVLAAVKRREVDERIELSDDDVQAIVEKLLKQGRDSAKQYQEADRNDLADKELSECQTLQEFMPTPFTEQEIDKILSQVIAESGANSPADMGKVMKLAKPQLVGRVDMSKISGLVKTKLS